MLHKIVLVEWEDSASWKGWRERNNCKELLPAICFSAGFLVKSNKKCVGISNSLGECTIGDTIVIPRSCIKKIKTLGRHNDPI